SQKTAVGERRRAILFADGGGFLADVKDVERRKLHAVSGLHGLDAPLEERVGPRRSQVDAVQVLDQVDLRALSSGIEMLVPQVADHLLRIDLGLVEVRALVLGRQKSGPPQAAAGRR